MYTTSSSSTLLTLVASAILLCTACSADGGEETSRASPTEPASAVPARTLRVSVKGGPQSASAKGALVVAPYTQCPPVGPPAGLLFARSDEPSFPATLDITRVPAGRYHVFAYRGGMQPAPADPQACSAEAVEVDESKGATIEIALP